MHFNKQNAFKWCTYTICCSDCFQSKCSGIFSTQYIYFYKNFVHNNRHLCLLALRRLPKFSVLFFGRDFNNSRFVDDSCGAVALLNDSDDPGLVSFLFLNVLKQKIYYSNRLNKAWHSYVKISYNLYCNGQNTTSVIPYGYKFLRFPLIFPEHSLVCSIFTWITVSNYLKLNHKVTEEVTEICYC